MDWLARTGEIRRLARAYANGRADDQPGHPSEALRSYLRSLWREPDFSRAATAVRQIRELLDEDWSDADMVETARLLGLPRPVGDRSVPEWLGVVGDLIEHAVEQGELPADAPPASAYEWRTAFPNLTGLISNSYHQDALYLHADPGSALTQTLRDADVFALTRAVGEIEEILALGLPEDELSRGIRWMGMSLRNPASSHQGLLRMIREASLAEISGRRQEGG